MPTKDANITHVTYPADGSAVAIDPAQLVVHGSKAAALEAAVDAGHKYVPVRVGESLADAIARYTAERSQQKAITAGPSSRRPGASA